MVGEALDEFERLPVGVRQAILAWTRTGGNLIVYNVKAKASESGRLQRLLELDDRAFGGNRQWHSPNLGARRTVQLVEESEISSSGGYGAVTMAQESSESAAEASGTGSTVSNEFVWKNGDAAFAHRDFPFLIAYPLER